MVRIGTTSTTIQQPSTMSGGSDSDEGTTVPFLCKAPLFGTTAASSHFRSAGTQCRSSTMRWDMGLAGQPSIMAGEWDALAPGHMRWHPEQRARTDQASLPASIHRTILTIGP